MKPSIVRTSADMRLYGAIFAVALGTLLLEIALLRILSYTLWYHFAYVVISAALLGFGGAGTFLAIRPKVGAESPDRTIVACSLSAAGATLALLFLIRVLPFDPLAILASGAAFATMLLYIIATAIPFAFAGLAVSLALRLGARAVHRLYAWDLAGGAAGCAIAVPAMNAVSPPGAAVVAAASFVAAGAILAATRRRALLAVAGAVVLSAALAPQVQFPIALSKASRLVVEFHQMEPILHRWTALFATDVARRVKLAPPGTREDWGLSGTVNDYQRAWGRMSHDGTAGAQIFDLREGDMAFLDDHCIALPYRITRANPTVLVIGVGGGKDLHAALRFGASRIVGVELDPVIVKLVRDDLKELHGGAFSEPRVEFVVGEGRSYVRRTRQKFDIIQITGTDTLAATANGVYVLAENYLYTVEAFKEFLDHLAPGGVLSIATGLIVASQPHAAGRMLTVGRQALIERGVPIPADHLAAINSRQILAEILIKENPFSARELDILWQESKRLNFEPLVLGRRGQPIWRSLATKPDGPSRKALLASLSQDLTPVRDDNPFFFHFYRWRDLLTATDFGGPHNTALSQLVVGVLVVVVTALAILFTVVPLLGMRRRLNGVGWPALGLLAYMSALGLGFMFFEISLMQRLILYLGYPTYSISVVLLSLLVFLGAGSALSSRFVGRELRALPIVLLALAALTAFYMLGLRPLQDATLSSPLALRVAITVAILAPLGVTLGVLLPLGIRRAEALHTDLVPWAWAVNGCTSVTGSVLAIALAMAFGFTRVWLISLCVYGAGIAAFLVTLRAQPRGNP